MSFQIQMALLDGSGRPIPKTSQLAPYASQSESTSTQTTFGQLLAKVDAPEFRYIQPINNQPRYLLRFRRFGVTAGILLWYFLPNGDLTADKFLGLSILAPGLDEDDERKAIDDVRTWLTTPSKDIAAIVATYRPTFFTLMLDIAEASKPEFQFLMENFGIAAAKQFGLVD